MIGGFPPGTHDGTLDGKVAMIPFRISPRIVPGSLLALLASTALLASCSSSGGGLQPPAGLHYANPTPTYSVGAPVTPDVPSVGGGAVSSWSVLPALPAGITLDPSSGTIQGTPTAVAAAQLHVVTAANAAGGVTAGVTITVTPAPTPPSGLTYSSNPAVYTVGQAITNNTPSWSGGQPTSYAVTPALPAGLSMDVTTGIISGAPTTPTLQATYTVQASNSGGPPTSVGLVLSVSATPQPILTLSYGSTSPSYAIGTPVRNSPIVTGGQPTDYTVTPALPGGLSINPTTGVISGTPTTASTAAPFVVTASNSSNSVPVTLSITITSAVAAPTLITYATPSPTYPAGQLIQQNVPTVTGGQPTAWSVAPSLPAGLSLNPNTGYISGTPTAVSAAAPYVISGSNSAGSASATLTIAVTITYGQLAVVVDHVAYTDTTVTASYTAVGSGPYTAVLKARLHQSGGITVNDSAIINFADNGSGATFNNTGVTALNCPTPVTSANPECVMLVNLPSASTPATYSVKVTVVGAILTESPPTTRSTW